MAGNEATETGIKASRNVAHRGVIHKAVATTGARKAEYYHGNTRINTGYK